MSGATTLTATPQPLSFGYPLGQRGNIIGRPYQGTHTLGNWQSDNAIDIAAPRGTPVYAVEDGTITKVSLNPEGGQISGDSITLGGRDNFFYTHLSRVTVKSGQKVSKGDVIGYSGVANGVAHLHFGRENGSPLSLVSAPIGGQHDNPSVGDIVSGVVGGSLGIVGPAKDAALDAAADAAKDGAQAALQAIWDTIGEKATYALLWTALLSSGAALAVYGLIHALGQEENAKKLALMAATRGAAK